MYDVSITWSFICSRFWSVFLFPFIVLLSNNLRFPPLLVSFLKLIVIYKFRIIIFVWVAIAHMLAIYNHFEPNLLLGSNQLLNKTIVTSDKKEESKCGIYNLLPPLRSMKLINFHMPSRGNYRKINDKNIFLNSTDLIRILSSVHMILC